MPDIPSYSSLLRGENDLAHGSAEVPPTASLDKTAHALALSAALGLGLSNKLNDQEWRDLVQRSGENALWAAYYMCLAGAAGPGTTAEQFDHATGFALPEKQVLEALSSETLTADQGLEFLAADSVNSCLGLRIPRPKRVALVERQSLIVKARLNRWAYAQGIPALIPADKADIREASKLVASQGCTDWNQTLSYAILVLDPRDAESSITSCASDRSLAGADPVALHTSVELGMSTGLAEQLAHSGNLASYLDTSWKPASSGQAPTGLGTVQNSLWLVNLVRATGDVLPSWLGSGADKQAATQRPSDFDPQLALLCVVADAKCGKAATQWARSQEDPVGRVVLGTLDDGTGAAIVQTLIETNERPELLRCPAGDVVALFRKAPQTMVQLATIDKACWETVAYSQSQLSSRIGAAIQSGAFEDAEALMLFASLKWSPDEIEPLKKSAQADLDLLVAGITREHGDGFLTDTRPIRYVLLQATIEKW